MSEALLSGSIQDQEKELINILIDSDLYLDLDLTERQKLLQHLVASCCRESAK
jgi:hypothetical protein